MKTKTVYILLVIFMTPLMVWLAYEERGYFAIGSEYLVVPALILLWEVKPWKQFLKK